MTDKHFCLDDSPWFRMVELDEVTSTNDFLRSYRPLGPERRVTLVTAEYQTAGRGAGQNHWESRRSENLLFSLLVHPRHIPAERMFVLSEVLALAIAASLNPPEGGLKIKWPNDIYYGDRKLCGMLIENELRGSVVERSVLGVGINVNQTMFEIAHASSYSPMKENDSAVRDESPMMGGFRGAPISLTQILGYPVERRFVLEQVMEHFTRYYEWTEQGRLDELHEMYLGHLYRKNEPHHFQDKNGEFLGTIIDVEPMGHLIITDETGQNRRYAFKEVEYCV